MVVEWCGRQNWPKGQVFQAEIGSAGGSQRTCLRGTSRRRSHTRYTNLSTSRRVFWQKEQRRGSARRRVTVSLDAPIIFDSKDNPGACTECLLIQFVPPEHRGQKIPCRHIPLNEAEETTDSLYRTGTQGELEEALGSWLRATIKRLEGERAFSARSLLLPKRIRQSYDIRPIDTST